MSSTRKFEIVQILILVLCFTVLTAGEKFTWPSHIPRCRAGDNLCIPKTLTLLFQSSDEIPELHLPSMDPLIWRKPVELKTRNKNSPISITLKNYNTTTYGLRKMIVTEVIGFGADPKNSKFEIHSKVPVIKSSSFYKSSMNFFAVPITMTGFSNTTLKNVEIHEILETDVIVKNGEEYLNLKNAKVELTLTKLSISFASIGGNQNIDQAINKAINENWKDIYYELKPDIEKNIGEVIQSLIKPLFDNIPYKAFFLPESN